MGGRNSARDQGQQTCRGIEPVRAQKFNRFGFGFVLPGSLGGPLRFFPRSMLPALDQWRIDARSHALQSNRVFLRVSSSDNVSTSFPIESCAGRFLLGVFVFCSSSRKFNSPPAIRVRENSLSHIARQAQAHLDCLARPQSI